MFRENYHIKKPTVLGKQIHITDTKKAAFIHYILGL